MAKKSAAAKRAAKQAREAAEAAEMQQQPTDIMGLIALHLSNLRIAQEPNTINANNRGITLKNISKEQKKKVQKAKNVAQVIYDWELYFGEGDGGLEDWRRLCRDLGLPGDLPSKTQCRNVSQT